MTRAIVVVDLGFGDAGKGSMVDYLVRARKASHVVRYNGGPQAGHNVVLPDGRSHTFSQFGAGTFGGASTHLSRYMLIEPFSWLREADHLQQLGVSHPFAKVTVDPHALVITPYHRIVNRAREWARGDQRHGSCGMGIGETQSDANQGLALRVGDLFNEGKTYNLLEGLRVRALEKTREIKLPFGMPVIEETCDSAKVGKFARGYRQFAKRHILTLQTQDLLGALRDQTVVFEGAQGVLLDENFGFHPYTTWSRTTTENADALLDEVGITNVERIGVLRPYQTRHGPGPLPTYDQRLTLDLPDPHNVFGEWQREFRLGWLDLTLLEYAVSAASINQLNCLAMTNLDTWIGSTQRPRVSHQYKDPQKLYPPIPMPYSLRDQESLCQILMKAEPEYQMLPSDQWDAIGPVVSERVKVPIRYLSTGPTYQSKVDLQ